MNNLKKYRSLAEMSQAKLAELAGCNQSYIGLVETGRSKLSFKMAERFGQILHADPLELIGDEILKFLSEDPEDFLPLVKSLATHYWDAMLGDGVPYSIGGRFMLLWHVMNSDLSDEDLVFLMKLIERMDGNKK